MGRSNNNNGYESNSKYDSYDLEERDQKKYQKQSRKNARQRKGMMIEIEAYQPERYRKW